MNITCKKNSRFHRTRFAEGGISILPRDPERRSLKYRCRSEPKRQTHKTQDGVSACGRICGITFAESESDLAARSSLTELAPAPGLHYLCCTGTDAPDTFDAKTSGTDTGDAGRPHKPYLMTLENTPPERIAALAHAQKTFFRTGETLPVDFRLRMLRRLLEALDAWERPLCEALWTDLHKSREEAYLTELSIVRGEIRNHLRHLKRWARPQRRATPRKLFPSASRILPEPLGSALIVAPWNYPVQLLLNPLVGAISAGCTAMLKPSPHVPQVAKILGEMIAATFDERYIGVAQGNRDVNTQLLAERWDLIFFTGSPALGRVVMTAAAQHLTPVVLELGGKSPSIVDRNADVAIAAKRIAWGKTLNAGQTCIAPDYVMVHATLREAFTEAYGKALKSLHGDDAQRSPYYVRMVDERAFDRVAGYLVQGKILLGGRTERAERYIEPTLLAEVDPAAPVMQEEIFGPVLPMLTFERIDEVVEFVNSREKPLAFYYFGDRKTGKEVLRRTTSGGACINDTIMHIANERLPFGGVGNSGMGRYHGRESFEVFSNRRAVVLTPTWPDIPLRYPPYRFFEWVKRIL